MVALSDNVLGRGQLPGVGGRETEGTKQAPRFAAGAVPSAAQHFVEQYADAYGNTLVFTGPGADGIWFTDDDVQSDYGANEIIYCGYRFDPESQLYYVRNRTYNPSLGRWIQRDPIGYQGGINLYEYVGSGPVAGVDWAGLAGAAPSGGISGQVDYTFAMQYSHMVTKKASAWVEKLKQMVVSKMVFSDKGLSIGLTVTGASRSNSLMDLSVAGLVFTAGYTITHQNGSKTTGSLNSSPGIAGAPPSVTGSLANTPPPGGGFGFGGSVGLGGAGFSAALNQIYSADVGGIKTQVSVNENYSANGSLTVTPSGTLGYTIPGLPVTVGGFGGGTVPIIGGGPASGYAGASLMVTLGKWSLTGTYCRSAAGGNAGGAQLKWGYGRGYVYLRGWDNTSNKSVGPNPPGGLAASLDGNININDKKGD